VNSGNRTSSIAVLLFLGAIVATDAGRVGEDGTGAMWVAPELLEALGEDRLPGCAHDVVIRTDLQTNGRVVFEWHPETGELSFATGGVNPALTLPEDFSSEPLIPVSQSCGSR
jgi:hypothetical protein